MTLENARKLKDGFIRIGSFVAYHGAEHALDIRDETEGRTIGVVGDAKISSDELLTTTVAGLNFVTQGGGVIDISGSKFIRTIPDCYLYCTSKVADVGHFSGYDTVVQIEDIEAFGRIIVDGRRDIFVGYHSNFVSYAPRVYDAMHNQGLDSDPFIKEEKYSRDQEHRIVFLPSGATEKYVNFELEGLRIAFRDGLCKII